MKSSDKAEFFKYLVGMSDVYRQPLSEAALSIWWEALADYPIEAIRAAMTQYVKTPGKRFAPAIGDVTEILIGSQTDAALLAWHEVLAAIRDYGHYHSVRFADPLVHHIITGMGGWIAVSAMTNTELPFRAKEFQALYMAHVLRKQELPQIGYLSGAYEIGNGNAGMERGVKPKLAIHDVENGGNKMRYKQIGEWPE